MIARKSSYLIFIRLKIFHTKGRRYEYPINIQQRKIQRTSNKTSLKDNQVSFYEPLKCHDIQDKGKLCCNTRKWAKENF